jgi:hypothetical protein
MKKLFSLAAVLVSFTLLAAVPQAKAQDEDDEDAKQAPMITWGGSTVPDFMTVFGSVSVDGRNFVSDRDHTSWVVSNPSVLKDAAGQHVSLLVTQNPQQHRISVKTCVRWTPLGLRRVSPRRQRLRRNLPHPQRTARLLTS